MTDKLIARLDAEFAKKRRTERPAWEIHVWVARFPDRPERGKACARNRCAVIWWPRRAQPAGQCYGDALPDGA